MTKRLQIPISEQELARFQAAAREALALLKRLEAPIAPVETIVEESAAGRYS